MEPAKHRNVSWSILWALGLAAQALALGYIGSPDATTLPATAHAIAV